ncbi:hypothetical protein JMJ77_0000735 [Colletotrichum scovillei]|uniref:Uncharacterized protein n=1 Tax=Colletotrichum scovillei TaxID=1209932 RepID=A0A9P7UKC7_9PEZI|nr:hypothetical protein JMJ77_0000735 [Colletotrichum scovillei]KAG7071947.1 hypothetical protein JMJ76_0004812 [Colletotrichum scovillei]KAG7080325.1 hypothetical protein JMJ78_0007422 [Colletotrichum scovillei]
MSLGYPGNKMAIFRDSNADSEAPSQLCCCWSQATRVDFG